VMCVVSVAGLLVVLSWGLTIAFWRHDEVAYLSDRGSLIRVAAEGRWVNFLAHPITRRIDPTLAWVANVLLVAAALYLIFRRLLDDRLAGFNLAIVGALFPGFVDQNTWPCTTLPASVIFLSSVVGVQRFGPWILLVSGILSFGSLSYFYYVLPLAFLPLKELEVFGDAADFVVPGVVWAAGLVLGLLVASTINLIFIGQFGIQLESWRRAHPATDLASLMENVTTYGSQIANDIGQWLPIPLLLLMGMVVIGCLTFKRYRRRCIGTALMGGSYASVVLLSPFMTVVPLGILVSFRSLLPLAVGTIALPFMLTDRAAHRPLLVATMVAIGLPSYALSSAGTEWFAKSTRAHGEIIAHAIATAGAKPSIVVVDARDYPKYFKRVQQEEGLGAQPFFMETLDEPKRLIPAFWELGFHVVHMCPRSGQVATYQPDVACAAYLQRVSSAGTCREDSRPVCVVDEQKGVLTLRLMP